MHAAVTPLPIASKAHPKRAASYSQATALQAKLATAVHECSEDLMSCTDRELRSRIGSALASMVRGWDILEERKRILRGRPLPGHLRPDLPASKRKPTRRVALLADPLDDVHDEKPRNLFSPHDGAHTPTP